MEASVMTKVSDLRGPLVLNFMSFLDMNQTLYMEG